MANEITNGCQCGCAECEQAPEWAAKFLSEPLLEAALLAGITPEQAAEVAFPHSQVSSKAGFTQTVYDNIVSAAQSGTFVAFNPGQCSGVSSGGNIKLIQTGGSLALTGVSIGLTSAGIAAAGALAPFTLGISALIGIFPMFFAHHAAAVAQERKVICAAVPAAQNYLQVIDQAVQSGQVDAAHGISALQSLLSDFTNQVSSIMKKSSSACNAACVWVEQLTAIVAMKSSEYQDLEAGAAQQIVPARPNTTAPSGTTAPASSYSSFYSGAALAPAAATSSLPNWWPIAAAAAVGLFLLRE
jgi:hypothetical protein